MEECVVMPFGGDRKAPTPSNLRISLPSRAYPTPGPAFTQISSTPLMWAWGPA